MKFKSGDIIKRSVDGYLRILLQGDNDWFIVRPASSASQFGSLHQMEQFENNWEKVGNIHEILDEIKDE